MTNGTQPKTSHELLVTEAARLITNELAGSYHEHNGTQYDTVTEGDSARLDYLTKGLAHYTTTTIQKIISMQDDNLRYWHYWIIDAVINGVVPKDESFISDYLHLAHLFSTTEVWKRTAEIIIALESFPYYEGLIPQGQNYECPQQRVEQCTAILTIVRHIEHAMVRGMIPDEYLRVEWFASEHEHLNALVEDKSDEIIRIIKDEKLRTLITAPDADLAGVVKIVTERNLLNADDIMYVLSSQKGNPAQAVNDGIL